MSDEIFSVATAFPDVATLAQGYLNRADGERLLLPLPSPCRQGSGVRFVVYLADGTPAFAGAGLCSQVSDQGNTVPPDQRYETLLDTLQFDERSQPVYDYIVAVRNAAYAAGGQAEAEAAEVEAYVDDGEVNSVAPEAAYADDGAQTDEATALVDAAEVAEVIASPDSVPSPDWGGEAQVSGDLDVAPEQQPDFYAQAQAEPHYQAPVSVQPSLLGGPMEVASFIPPPLPTGLLTRPARTTHWQPAPPRRPTPRPATGLFRYGAAGLPKPARPPYPDLDRSAWVQPAPQPGQ